MRIIIASQLAFRSLKQNLLRTSLTVLGVVVGVVAIVIVFSAGEMLNNLISGEIEAYGTNSIQVEAKQPGKNRPGRSGLTSLKMTDLKAIDRLENIRASYAASLTQARVAYEAESQKVMVFGTSAPFPIVNAKIRLAAGDYFSESEDNSQAQVAVLGSKLKETLYGEATALGTTIRIGSKKFKVTGVLEEQEGFQSFIDFNEMVYIPINTLQKKILGIDYATYFTHQVKDAANIDETAEEIRRILRERHEIVDDSQEDFRVTTMAEMQSIFQTVTNAVTYLLLAIVLISLLVGGVGIMNIMQVTVVERTPEIGLRKALGAAPLDIVWQFLVEAVLITFWGWLLGAILGVAGAYLLANVSSRFGFSWNFAWPWTGLGVALLFSLANGFLFGYRPARQAAKLDPVEALRTE